MENDVLLTADAPTYPGTQIPDPETAMIQDMIARAKANPAPDFDILGSILICAALFAAWKLISSFIDMKTKAED